MRIKRVLAGDYGLKVGTKYYRPGQEIPNAVSVLRNLAVLERLGKISIEYAEADQPQYTTPEPPAVLALLDNSIAYIADNLADLSLEDLYILLNAERAGKTRKGAIEAIEAEINARAQ